MSAQHTPWPTHADGRSMTLGEMTPEQRRERVNASVKRFESELQRNAPAIAKVLRDFDDAYAAIAKTGSAS